MRVLILAKFLPKDGATTHMFTLANGLADRGHEVHLMSGGPPNDKRSESLFEQGISKGKVMHHKVGFPNYFNYKIFSQIKQLLTYIAIIPRTILSIKRINPEVIHVHYPVTSYMAWLYCKLAKKKFVTTYHIKGITNQVLHKKANKAIAISSEMKTELHDRWGYSNDEISLVFNGISKDRFNKTISKEDKRLIRKKLNLPFDKVIIGFVGTYQYKKGIDILLESCSKLDRNDYNIVLLGDGDLEWVNSLIKKYDLKDKVILSGFRDPVEYYAAFDIFVLPSRNEGFPLVALEAMMMGVPTIRSNVSGAYDMIEHEDNGYIFESENREELKYYIETLLDNEELRNQLGLRGKQSTLNNFTEDIMIDNMVKVYESLSKKERTI